jgi:hypothetical protein
MMETEAALLPAVSDHDPWGRAVVNGLVGFAVAIAINLARGRVIDCGCAGSAAAVARRLGASPFAAAGGRR